CPSAPLAGTTRCKMHGGVGVRGIAHPGFRGAGYSKDLPKYLAKTYRQAVDDPDLLSMRNEVALLHVRLEELTRRLGTPESGRGWAELRAARDRMHEARSIPDAAARGAALARELEVIDRVILHGSEHEANWAEVERAVARKVAVAAREWKRLVDLQQLITAESAMQLVAGIMLAVKEHVTDPNALQGIAQKMRLLLHRPDRPA
ncbi:MAG TPA: hypothetical protein VJ739_06030, partial [Gemmataceae bacterium]|nr:hypothetical protein [Gemmataceae bacterium]